MTMQECYEAIGGNYEAVLGRLHSEALIRRFALKFLEDQSYIQLKQALEKVPEVYEMTIEEIKKGRVALSDATRLSVLDQVLGTS